MNLISFSLRHIWYGFWINAWICSSRVHLQSFMYCCCMKRRKIKNTNIPFFFCPLVIFKESQLTMCIWFHWSTPSLLLLLESFLSLITHFFVLFLGLPCIFFTGSANACDANASCTHAFPFACFANSKFNLHPCLAAFTFLFFATLADD